MNYRVLPSTIPCLLIISQLVDCKNLYQFHICLLDERETLGLISVDALVDHTLCNKSMNMICITPISDWLGNLNDDYYFGHCRL